MTSPRARPPLVKGVGHIGPPGFRCRSPWFVASIALGGPQQSAPDACAPPGAADPNPPSPKLAEMILSLHYLENTDKLRSNPRGFNLEKGSHYVFGGNIDDSVHTRKRSILTSHTLTNKQGHSDVKRRDDCANLIQKTIGTSRKDSRGPLRRSNTGVIETTCLSRSGKRNFKQLTTFC